MAALRNGHQDPFIIHHLSFAEGRRGTSQFAARGGTVMPVKLRFFIWGMIGLLTVVARMLD